MNRLLHIPSSPRGGASESLQIASVFIEAFRDAHPDAEVDTGDFWDGSLPGFGPAVAAAKMTVFGGGTPRGAEQAACGRRPARRSTGSPRPTGCCSACRCGTRGVPYVLKQFIDVIASPAGSSGRPRRGLPAPARRPRHARRGDLHQRGVGPGPRPGVPAGTSSPPTSTTGCAGPASPTSATSASTRRSAETPRPRGWPRTRPRASSARRLTRGRSQHARRRRGVGPLTRSVGGGQNATNAPR